MSNVNEISLFKLVMKFAATVSSYRDEPWLNNMKVAKKSIRLGRTFIKENMHPWYYVDVLDNIITTFKIEKIETKDEYFKRSLSEDIAVAEWLREICHTQGFLAKDMKYNCSNH